MLRMCPSPWLLLWLLLLLLLSRPLLESLDQDPLGTLTLQWVVKQQQQQQGATSISAAANGNASAGQQQRRQRQKRRKMLSFAWPLVVSEAESTADLETAPAAAAEGCMAALDHAAAAAAAAGVSRSFLQDKVVIALPQGVHCSWNLAAAAAAEAATLAAGGSAIAAAAAAAPENQQVCV
jgi:hypothetical protein